MVGCVGAHNNDNGCYVLDYQSLKTTWAYTEAVKRLSENDEVASQLGQPLKFGVVWSWRKSESSVMFAIPMEGSKGRAVAYVSAKKVKDGWRFYRFAVYFDGHGKRMDLY
ncbi:MAG: hypothetical protein GXP50_11040 [Deltaproteobacteria bacterium]|nr:hypothetical protein [Deltaproteobacteria bacterium]